MPLTYLDVLNKASLKAREARAIITKAVETELRELTDAEMAQVTALGQESDSLRAQGEALQAAEARETYFRTPVTEPIRPDVTSTETRTPPPPGSEFANFGEFVQAVVEKRVKNLETRAMSMGDGTAGGILVPEQFTNTILKVNPESVIVRPRATVIPAGSPPDAKIGFPVRRQGSLGAFGGMTFYWTAEGGAIAETSASLDEIELEPKECSAHIVVNNKLLRNAPAISGLIQEWFADTKAAFEDYTFLRGNGVGKPLGFLNSPGRKNIARAGASAIAYADILKMCASVDPSELAECFWVASISTMEQLMALKDTGNNNIFWGGYGTPISGAMPSRLNNLELRWTGRTPTLGNAGDLMLVNPKYYLIKDGSGPYLGMDESVYRLTGRTVVYFFWNVDGQLWTREPLLLEDGTTTVSPVVVLN